jgi:hypothetical protein
MIYLSKYPIRLTHIAINGTIIHVLVRKKGYLRLFDIMPTDKPINPIIIRFTLTEGVASRARKNTSKKRTA